MCGEVVFRGDECVSLGWCFWHRGCYGCLICGDRRVAEGVTVEQLFDVANGGSDSGDDGDGETDVGGNQGREVDVVPLCGKCAGETLRDRADDERLVPMALERIDRYDGGLSRRRWEAGLGRARDHSEYHTRRARLGINRLAGEIDQAFDGRATHGEFSRKAQRLELGDESSPTPTRPCEREEPSIRRSPSSVYVSMHDPIGEPAFRPSKTKPIPRWMQYLPSQRQGGRDSAGRPASGLDDHLSPSESSTTNSDTNTVVVVPPRPPPIPPHTMPLRQSVPTTRELPTAIPAESYTSARSPIPSRSTPDSIPTATRRAPSYPPAQMPRPFTSIAEEPSQRPSSRLGAGRLPPSRHVRFTGPPQTSSTEPGYLSGRTSEPSKFLGRHTRHHEDVVGGDGVVEDVVDADGPMLVSMIQNQLKRVFVF